MTKPSYVANAPKSISWGNPGLWSDVVAVRSEVKGISLLDLTPINLTDVELFSKEGFGNSITWTPDGDYLARLVGDYIHINDSRYAFCESAHISMPGTSLRCITFAPTFDTSQATHDDMVVLLAAVGLDGRLHLLKFTAPNTLELLHSVFVEEHLWVVSWSPGTVLFVNLCLENFVSSSFSYL